MDRTSNSPHDESSAVPAPERRSVLLRAYAEAEAKKRKSDPLARPSNWILFFDTETCTDETQRLRFGTFQLWQGTTREIYGVFYDPDAVGDVERIALQTEAQPHGYDLFVLDDFIEKVFFGAAYRASAIVVGFNLPFDLSRLAKEWQRARRVRRTNKRGDISFVDQSMVGGFTLTLSERTDRPNLRIKHLSRRASFINFAVAADDVAMRNKRKTGARIEHERGFFVDVKTLAAALTSTSHSLESLAKSLDVAHKSQLGDFDRQIDADFIRYALNDTEVTRQCYLALIARYDQHVLTQTKPHRIYSEASLGKAYLREMNVRPWREMQPDFDPEIVGAIMSSYFGGRSEVHRRREIVPTLYCDFASMYPTVCTLMGLWRFSVSTGIVTKDATSNTQALLDEVTVSTLHDPNTWKRLPVLVRVQPKADIFPVRARYGEEPMATIGLNYLTADEPLWFTLADCIASKLSTGRPPTVVEAIAFTPKEVQDDLRPIKISGNDAYEIHPARDDFYKRVIDLRRSVKTRQKAAKKAGAAPQELARLEAEQLALKILANATSYGIFIELNVEGADNKDESVDICTSSGRRGATSSKREKPGDYFHPLLGTLITGAARLMLAITERLLIGEGLDWAFCDTDSMAFAATDGMGLNEFERRVRSVCACFASLNPYEKAGSILEFEDHNYGRDPTNMTTLEPLFCAAVSSKRYALFNLDRSGEPVIRKASAHGLGHFLQPYDDEAADRRERESGVTVWQEDLWKSIIRSLRSKNPMHLALDWRQELSRPAVSQYTAATPARLDWFKKHDRGKPWVEKVRPFNFMLEFYGKRPDEMARQGLLQAWHDKRRQPKPVASYSRDPYSVISRVWDRGSGEPVSEAWLRTYAEALRGYHHHPETKFLRGGPMDSGPTQRRHIFVENVEDIGKEADKWDDDEPITADDKLTVSYGTADVDFNKMIEVILSLRPTHLAAAARVSHHTVPKNAPQADALSGRILQKLFAAASRLKFEEESDAREDAQVVSWLKHQVERHDLTQIAEDFGVDVSNLGKMLEGKRRLPSKLKLRVLSDLVKPPC